MDGGVGCSLSVNRHYEVIPLYITGRISFCITIPLCVAEVIYPFT